MAQGRSTEIISVIKWIWTSRLRIKKSLSVPHSLDGGRVWVPEEKEGDVEAVHRLQLKVYLVEGL